MSTVLIRQFHRASLFALLFLPTLTRAQEFIPNHQRTPGTINDHVTQDKAALTVCVAGWTRTIRPPSSYTSR